MNDMNTTESQVYQATAKILAINKLNSLSTQVQRERLKRRLNTTIYFWIALMSAFLSGAVGSYGYMRITHPQFNVPYSIYLQEITPEISSACVADPNCMDIGLMTDLPQRDLEADKIEGGQQ